MLRLGKQPARVDRRTLKLAAILKVLPPIPEEWSFDENCPIAMPLPMFGNDQWGDCVIAGRAHQTLRFEYFEQNTLLPIKDSEVLYEYWREQGGCWLKHPDNGLVVLDSLKAWRKRGWRVGKQTYTMYAFAGIEPKDHAKIKASIYLFNGAGAGLLLPLSAQEQFYENKVWSVSPCDSFPGSWGGHYVYLVGYNQAGPICITWGRPQQMTWQFVDTCCDELFAIIDNRNPWLKESVVDVEKLSEYLEQVAKEKPQDG